MVTERATTWTNQDVVLFHGTDSFGASSIGQRGVSLEFSRALLDFGRGFYTTTSRSQAQDWAVQKAAASRQEPIVVAFEVAREVLANLDSIWFVRATEDNDDLWSFVDYCRRGGGGHARIVPSGCYDVVIGPVTLRTTPSRSVLPGSDQVSFHTDRSIKVLNEAKREIVAIAQ